MSSPSRTRPVSHQTVRLAAGRHATPDEGVSVMELASMLAGERFSARPKAVCRVIGALLRAYDDAMDDERRRDLYACAAEVVWTRTSRFTRRARLERCELELALLRPRSRGRGDRLVRRLRRALPGGRAAMLADLARTLAAIDGGHERALALIAELVRIHVAPPPPCLTMSGPHAPGTSGRR
jgi:hypothetical protein